MILQSLVKLYDALAERGTLEKPGWELVKLSWALDIDEDGRLLRVLPLEQVEMQGKKQRRTQRTLRLPKAASRTSLQCNSGFLWDNSGYMIGYDNRSDRDFLCKKFASARKLHQDILNHVNSPAAIAICRFFESWDMMMAPLHEAIVPYAEEICNGNITFVYKGEFAVNCEEIRDAWDEYQTRSSEENLEMRCLVSGRKEAVARLHPKIKGVWSPSPTAGGSNLVSFNGSAFESFGRFEAQGLNAPVSIQAAFAYGAALNYLLASPQNHIRMGETTVVFWAENAEDGYAQFLMDIFDTGLTDQQLMDALKAVASGVQATWNDEQLDPDNRFCILGLAPNAARLSVRFFLCDSFGALMKNVRRHQEDLEIIKPADDSKSELSLWWLLQETVNQKSRDKTPHPQMVGDLARAILQGSMYPATLYEQVQLRIRAERKITRGRAAIIKAYLLRQPNFMHKEVLTVQLNEHTNYQPYLLGRLFAVLEALQKMAIPGINATIRDKYFSSASATPAIVFPTLIRLAQAHLKKLDYGWRIHFDRQIGEILQQMETNYPTRLSLQDQGVFQLGYYHQTQQRFMKKEAEENV